MVYELHPRKASTFLTEGRETIADPRLNEVVHSLNPTLAAVSGLAPA